MRKKLLSMPLALIAVIFLITSCSSKSNGISKDKLTGAIKNFDACMADCDAKQAEYDTKFWECVRSKPIPEACWHVPPDNRAECISNHLTKVINDCKEQLKPLADEVARCRQSCRDMITKLEKDTQ